MEEHIQANPHHLSLTDRHTGTITGVKDVISFDLNAILLETESGMLSIKGHDLHVNRLSVEKGEIEIAGTIDGMVYSDVIHMPGKVNLFLPDYSSDAGFYC